MRPIDNCNMCGKCNLTCPLFALLKKETMSNRHKAFMIREKTDGPETFYFLLDGSVKKVCPASIDLDEALVKRRYWMNKKGKESPSNKEMISNIRRNGKPVGKKFKPFFC